MPLADEPPGLRVTLLELALLGVIVLVGLWLRAAHPARMSVEHFDEGVYASNWFCRPPGLPEGIYPLQHLYAPPLLPELCFWTLFTAGGSPHAVVWINVAAGSLMIPLLWWVGRSWFGSAAGLIAAACCAASDVHVALSRTVLTDVLLCLFLTAGVWTGRQAIVTGRPASIVLAGVLAALAWWTKYNGWLTLAITGAGLAGWLIVSRPHDVRPGQLIVRWLLTVLIALALWSPWLWMLQDVGGYAAVASNHSRYVVGLSGWWSSAASQLARLGAFESWLGLGLATASIAFLPAASSDASIASGRLRGVLPAAAVFLLSLALGFVAAGLLLAFAASAMGVVRGRRDAAPEEGHQEATAQLSHWILLAWLIGLAVSTPLYTPYPRLSLPLICALWLGLGALLSTPLAARSAEQPKVGSLMQLAAAAVLSACLLYGVYRGGGPAHGRPHVAWQDRRGLERTAGPLVDAAAADVAANPTPGKAGIKAVLYVYAEPALFYHLSALPQPPEFRYIVQPAGDHALLETSPPDSALATYLIAGPHARAVASDADAIDGAERDGRLAPVASFAYQPSDLVLLDQTDPAGIANADEATLRLYRVR